MTTPLRSAHGSFVALALLFLAFVTGCQKGPAAVLTLRLHGSGAVPSAAELEEARAAIERRLAEKGVSPASVQTSGSERLTVRIPFEGDSKRLRSLLTTSAVLELRFVRFPVDGLSSKSREEVLAHF